MLERLNPENITCAITGIKAIKDSLLNIASSVFYDGLIRPTENNDPKLIFIIPAAVIGIGFVGYFFKKAFTSTEREDRENEEKRQKLLERVRLYKKLSFMPNNPYIFEAQETQLAPSPYEELGDLPDHTREGLLEKFGNS